MIQDRVKLPVQFDVARMQSDIALVNDREWINHFVTQNYEGDWSVLPLRGPADAIHPILMSYSDPACKDFADTPFLSQLNYLPEVLDWFQCPLMSVRLMRLTPGSRILTHVDHDLSADLGMARLHVPITTNGEVRFILNKRQVPLNLGECWYLRLSDPHSVDSKGQTERVHLVLDVEVNDWFTHLLGSTSTQ